MDYVLLLIYLLIAIGFSFLCSIAEAVLLSITPSYLAERKQDPSKSAQRIIRLKENIDRPLAAMERRRSRGLSDGKNSWKSTVSRHPLARWAAAFFTMLAPGR